MSTPNFSLRVDMSRSMTRRSACNLAFWAALCVADPAAEAALVTASEAWFTTLSQSDIAPCGI